MAETASPFFWGSNGERLTPDQVERKRKVAQALMKEGGNYSPVQSWTQGAARVAQALVGGWEDRKAGEAEKANAAEDSDLLSGLLAGATGAPAAVAAPAAAPSAAGPSQKVAYAPGGDSDPNPALDAIMKFESGGKNVHQNIVPAGGGFNPSTGTVTGPSSAQGYFQMITPTWRSAAKMAGIDTAQYPTAMAAPYEVQRKAAAALYAKEGFAPWAPYNAALRAHIAKGGLNGAQSASADMPAPGASPVEAPTGQSGFAIPQGARPVESIPGDDPAKLRAEAQAYAQTNPEAARQMLARADAAEASMAPAPMPPARPADLAMAPPAAPGMTAQTFAQIQGGQPLEPVFQSEGASQPWMGTAIPPQQPAMVAQAAPTTLPPPRPADLPAPGAVEASGQMPPQAAPQPQMMPDLSNSPDGGMRALQVQAEQARQNQPQAPQVPMNPLARVAAAMGGASPQAAPAAPQSPAVAAVAQAVAQNPGDPLVKALTSPYASEGTKRVAFAMLSKRLESQNKAQWTEQTLPDGSLAQRNSQTGEMKIVRPGVDPLDREGKRLDVETKRKALADTKAPPTLKIKQADGSEVVLERDAKTGVYAPIQAPLGGAAVGPTSGNTYALPGKPTVEQSKSAGYANRMAEAHAILDPIEEIGTDKVQAGLNNIPVVGNMVISKQRQSYNQAKENFITAVLRSESGAVISDSEFKREENKYFPQPGEGPEQVKQKRQSRITAMKSMMGAAGSGYKIPDGLNVGEKKPKETKQDGPPPPAGVDANVWKHMTPEERALWK